MAVNLRILSLLGTAGAGAGISTPLTLNYLRKGDTSDISLSSDDGGEDSGLIRSRRSSGSGNEELNNLFKKRKKGFRKQVDKKAVDFTKVIDAEFKQYSSTWENRKNKISKSVSDVGEKLWNTLDLQDNVFEKQKNKILGYFGELEKATKDIEDIGGLRNQKELVSKIQELENLLRVHTNKL